MNELLPLIGVLAVASLTPGPNNVLVVQAAAAGRGAVARTIAGVLLGSLLLLTLVAAGVAAIVERVAGLATALALGGYLWLAWMGVRLIWPARSGIPTSAASPRASLSGAAAFQLSNPKAWLLVITAVSALPSSSGPPTLAVLIVIISGASLLLWAAAGVALGRQLASAGTRRNFDRAMGIALTVSALGGIWHVVI